MIKQILAWCVVAAVALLAACNGNSGNSAAQSDSARLEQPGQDSAGAADAERLQREQEEQARIKAEKEEQERIEAEKKKKEWHGASSRSDLKAKLNGTTWETTSPYHLTGLLYRFEITGNNVRNLCVKPTRNYDDPKDWGAVEEFYIYEIAEPKQGTFCVILKAKKEDSMANLVPTILVFRDDDAYYSLDGEIGPSLKKID